MHLLYQIKKEKITWCVFNKSFGLFQSTFQQQSEYSHNKTLRLFAKQFLKHIQTQRGYPHGNIYLLSCRPEVSCAQISRLLKCGECFTSHLQTAHTFLIYSTINTSDEVHAVPIILPSSFLLWVTFSFRFKRVLFSWQVCRLMIPLHNVPRKKLYLERMCFSWEHFWIQNFIILHICTQ